MINLLPFRIAVYIALTQLILLIIFHLLIMAEVLPYTEVWGGHLEDINHMKRFELVSILINAFQFFVIGIKAKYIKLNISRVFINFILWLFVVMFCMNTIGNLFAKTMTERIIFTPVTIIMAVSCLRIVKEKDNLSAN